MQETDSKHSGKSNFRLANNRETIKKPLQFENISCNGFSIFSYFLYVLIIISIITFVQCRSACAETLRRFPWRIEQP